MIDLKVDNLSQLFNYNTASYTQAADTGAQVKLENTVKSVRARRRSCGSLSATKAKRTVFFDEAVTPSCVQSPYAQSNTRLEETPRQLQKGMLQTWLSAMPTFWVETGK